MRLRPLDVFWVRDPGAFDPRTNEPGKWKMVVAMAPDAEPPLFFRINSRDHGGRHDGWRPRPGSVPLPQAAHPFLTHDSYLYCGGPPLAIDEGLLAESQANQKIEARRGVVGRIDPALLPDLRRAVADSEELTSAQRDAILAALEAAQR